jgi:hypothetical protein
MDSTPQEFRCPISMELMIDPVLCEDGHTYERKNIEEWLRRNPTSPLTRQSVNPSSLRQNYALKTSIERWKKQTIKPVSVSNLYHQQVQAYQPPPYQGESYQVPIPTIVYQQTSPQQIDKNKLLKIICSVFIFLLIIIIIISIKNETVSNDDD